jgi:hypothetical protein
MNTSILMWGVIFGSIGFGFFLYGKKQKVFIPIISGVGLMVIPYLISNVLPLVSAAVVLMILPFVVKR